MDFLNSFYIAGSIASIVSFFLALRVVWGIDSCYKRHIILPKLISELNGSIKNMRYQNERNNIEKLRTELEICDVILESIHKYTDRNVKKRIKTTRQKLKSLLSGNDNNFQKYADGVINKVEACEKSANIFSGEDIWKK